MYLMSTFLTLLRNAAEVVENIYKVCRCDDEELSLWSPVRKRQKRLDSFSPSPC